MLSGSTTSQGSDKRLQRRLRYPSASRKLHRFPPMECTRPVLDRFSLGVSAIIPISPNYRPAFLCRPTQPRTSFQHPHHCPYFPSAASEAYSHLLVPCLHRILARRPLLATSRDAASPRRGIPSLFAYIIYFICLLATCLALHAARIPQGTHRGFRLVSRELLARRAHEHHHGQDTNRPPRGL